MNTIYAIVALAVLAIILMVQAPKINMFFVYPKKTLIWVIFTSTVLLVAFLVFSFLAMR